MPPLSQTTMLAEVRCTTCGNTVTVPAKAPTKGLRKECWRKTKSHGWVCDSCHEEGRHKRGCREHDLIWFKSQSRGHNRHWVVFKITDWDIHEGNADVLSPGLYAFGGLWHNQRLPDRIKDYGKVLPVPKDFVVVGRIWDFDKDTIRELVE